MDVLDFSEDMARTLERVYATRDVRRRRALVQEALDPAAGERILDVGCGPGFYLEELLERVGGGGHVAGVDPSGPMLAMAGRRTEGAANVTIEDAQATSLPFNDESFDAALSVQVLEYVGDVESALAEIRRVLRPGGRVVLWDVDWATVSMSARDADRAERVLRAWDRHVAHPSLPKALPAMLRRTGFDDVVVTGHSFTTNEFTPDAYGASLVGIVEGFLAALDDFPSEDAKAWADEQRALGDTGDFYFACVQCCIRARVPGQR